MPTGKKMKSTIIEISKVISAIVIIGSAALWLDGRFDKQAEDLKDIMTTVEYINVEQSLQSAEVQGIQDTLGNIEDQLDKQSSKINSLHWAIQNIDNFTPEQMREVLDREFRRERELKRTSDIEFIPID